MDSPFYEECTAGFADVLAERWAQKTREDPLLRQTGHVSHYHGETMVCADVAGQGRTGSIREFRGAFSLQRDTIETGDRTAFLTAMEGAVTELREALLRHLFEVISAAADEAGNVVDAAGLPLDGRLLCDAIEKIDVSFDAHGRPVLPTICCSPEQAARIRALCDDRVVQLRLNAILVKKWFARYGLWTPLGASP